MNKKKSRTCISVIKNRAGKLIMAGDRRASWDWDFAQSMPRPKIQKRNGLLLGATGEATLCTLLVDVLSVPKREVSSLDTYMFQMLKSGIEKLLKQQGFTDDRKNLRLPMGCAGAMLVGISGHLYTVELVGPAEDAHLDPSLINIDEVGLPFAVGCGASTAIPILIAEKRKLGYSTKEHLTLAMEIAAEISPGCDNKIDYVKED